jgi:hypothetical protein
MIKTERKQNNWKSDARRADIYIQYCPSCKMCYEPKFIGQGSVRSKTRINHYPDFVSYGRKRKECISCKKGR